MENVPPTQILLVYLRVLMNFFWVIQSIVQKYVNVCMVCALWWTDVLSWVDSHLATSVPGIGSGSFMTLTLIKQLLKLMKLMNVY